MYDADDLDRLITLYDLPKQEPNVPSPLIFAEETSLVLTYWELDDPPYQPNSQPVAIVRFLQPWFHLFGPPNDEALSGHTLANRGLTSSSAFKVERSSLIRRLAKMNSIHPRHDPKRFDALNHYIFTFRDSLMECVALGLETTIDQVGIEKYTRTFQEFMARANRP